MAVNNATTTTIPTYSGTLHHRIYVIIWIDTGRPPSSLICDKTPAHVNPLTNSATTSSIVHMFIVIIWKTGLPSPAAIPIAATNATTTRVIITPTTADDDFTNTHLVLTMYFPMAISTTVTIMTIFQFHMA